jgi:hypothetical protein
MFFSPRSLVFFTIHLSCAPPSPPLPQHRPPEQSLPPLPHRPMEAVSHVSLYHFPCSTSFTLPWFSPEKCYTAAFVRDPESSAPVIKKDVATMKCLQIEMEKYVIGEQPDSACALAHEVLPIPTHMLLENNRKEVVNKQVE